MSYLNSASFDSRDIKNAVAPGGRSPMPCDCNGIFGVVFKPEILPNGTEELSMTIIQFQIDPANPNQVVLNKIPSGISSIGSPQRSNFPNFQKYGGIWGLLGIKSPNAPNFDLVFFDSVKMHYLAKYQSFSPGSLPTTRIVLERTLVALSNGNINYHSLKARPEPDPANLLINPNFDDRDAVAYEIGAACPPHWNPNAPQSQPQPAGFVVCPQSNINTLISMQHIHALMNDPDGEITVQV